MTKRGSNRYSPVQRARRASARTALYGSLGVVFLLLLAGLSFQKSLSPALERPAWADIDFPSLPEVQRFQGYLQIDTSQPNANEIEGARFLAAELEKAGIRATVEELGDQRANLWAVLEGESPDALVLHNHIDTDPVSNEQYWRHPPFSGAIEERWIYGRGAYDMKSIAIAQLETMLELAARERKPKRSVIFLATGSEEVGSDFGMRWILANHPELADRFWAVLTEGGAIETRADGEEDFIKYWGTEFGQKRLIDVTLCGSSEERLTLVRDALLDQHRTSNLQFDLVPEVESYLSSYAGTRDREDFRRFLSQTELLALDMRALQKMPAYVRGLFRDEALPFRVEQAEGGGYELLIKFHLLPGSDFEEVRQRLLPEWMTHGLTVSVYDEGGADGGSPLDHPVFVTLQDVLREELPDAPMGPHFLPWTATDARFTRAHGVPTYGFAPFPVLTAETLRIGMPNEHLSLPDFLRGVELYKEAVSRLVD